MNMTIQRMACSMLDESGTPHTFLGEVVHIAMDILNKYCFPVNNDKTPYEIWYGKPKIVKHFRIFGSKCFIKKNDHKLGKFESRMMKESFLDTLP